MKNLIIDIGNTRIKSGIFEDNNCSQELAFDSLNEAINHWNTIDFNHCMVSSVRWTELELSEQLDFEFIYFSTSTLLPVSNAYGSPATLGLDRMAAAVGGWTLSGFRAVLAIDLGSCITFDLIDGNNSFIGGAISPGLQMRAKAMHTQTARLPLVDLAERPTDLTGTSTISCMQSGIWYGVEFEILGSIAAYRKKYPEIQVFVCGGDAQSFDSLAKDHIFVVPNLVLHGLNSILNHNVE